MERGVLNMADACAAHANYGVVLRRGSTRILRLKLNPKSLSVRFFVHSSVPSIITVSNKEPEPPIITCKDCQLSSYPTLTLSAKGGYVDRLGPPWTAPIQNLQ
jgi:hypothetical protein